MSSVVRVITPQFLRTGLDELFRLPDGIKSAVAEIGLGTARYTPTGEETAARAEIVRIPVDDMIEAPDGGILFYAQQNSWTGDMTGIYEIVFYLKSGTPLSIYSSNNVEMALIEGQPNDLFYTLKTGGLPADKLEIINTQTVFTPDREWEDAVFNLSVGQLDHHNRLNEHNDQLTAEHQRNNQQDVRLDRHDAAFSTQSRAIAARDAAIEVNSQNVQWLALNFASEIEMIRSFIREFGQDGTYRVKNHASWDYMDYPAKQQHQNGYAEEDHHNHWDHWAVNGIAQFSFVIGGIYEQLKHTDYSRLMPADAGSSYLATRIIDYPAVQSDVTGTVEQQTAKIAQYILAREDESLRAGLANFAESTTVYMTYVELYPEYQGAADLDSIAATRHALTADSFEAAVKEFQGWNWTGLQDPIQNYSALSSIQLGVNEKTGELMQGIWKPRVLMAPVGSYEEYPLHKILKEREDILTKNRSGYYNARRARFEVIDPDILREMIAKIPGLDGYGANINVPFKIRDTTYYIDEYKQRGTRLNQAYYHDRYSLREDDANGRRDKTLGFSRPSFTAHNTRPEIIPVKIGNKQTRISIMLPLELVVIDQRQNWNPHGLKNVTNTHSYGEYAEAGKDADNPLPGYWHQGIQFYKTPAALYSANGSSDPADTASSFKYALDRNGNTVAVSPAGVPPLLPPVQGKTFRQRWFINNVYDEGTVTHREMRQRAEGYEQMLLNLTIGQLSQHNTQAAIREQLMQRFDGKTDFLRELINSNRDYTDEQLFTLIASVLSLSNQSN